MGEAHAASNNHSSDSGLPMTDYLIGQQTGFVYNGSSLLGSMSHSSGGPSHSSHSDHGSSWSSGSSSDSGSGGYSGSSDSGGSSGGGDSGGGSGGGD